MAHSPTWAVALPSGDWEPVTLVMALEDTPAARRLPMIARHQEVLASFAQIGNQVLATTAWDAPERPGLGFHLLVFAAELASALDACAEPAQRRACAETISGATLVAAACLAAAAARHPHADG